jgi:hypothetical protein
MQWLYNDKNRISFYFIQESVSQIFSTPREIFGLDMGSIYINVLDIHHIKVAWMRMKVWMKSNPYIDL